MKITRYYSRFIFGVYRKETHSGQYLHYFSHHPLRVKKSTVFGLLLRAYRICDPINLDPEISFLFQAFKKIGYPQQFLDKVHGQVKRKFYGSDLQQRERINLPTINIPYNELTERVFTPFFRHNGFNVVHSAKNTLRSNLVQTRPRGREDVGDRSGVYTVKCAECDDVYIGETGRGFSTRLKEHKDAVRLGKHNNAIFKHVYDTNHAINWEGSKLLFESKNLQNRLIVESALIKSVANFNTLPGVCSVDRSLSNLILKSNPSILRKFNS